MSLPGEILTLPHLLSGNLWLVLSMSAEPKPKALWFPGVTTTLCSREVEQIVLALSAHATSGLHWGSHGVRNAALIYYFLPKVAKNPNIMSANNLLTHPSPWPTLTQRCENPPSLPLWSDKFGDTTPLTSLSLPLSSLLAHLPHTPVYMSLPGLQFPALEMIISISWDDGSMN